MERSCAGLVGRVRTTTMRVKEPSTTIIFIRHGSTDFPEDRVYKGDNGPNLNAEGRLQADRLGAWIKEGEIEERYADGLEKWKKGPINYTPQDHLRIVPLSP